MIEEKNCKNFNENSIYSYKERLNLNINEKKRIVERAMKFIHNNGTYFFDVSTTVEFLAKGLKKKATIFTHSLDNFNILSQKQDVLVNLIGGEFNNKNRFFYSKDFSKYFDGIEFDSVFLGAGAIKSDGIYYENKEDALIKNEVAKRARKIILLAEHQKYEKTAKYKGLDLGQVNIIIVDPISVSLFGDIITSQDIKINPNSLVII